MKKLYLLLAIVAAVTATPAESAFAGAGAALQLNLRSSMYTSVWTQRAGETWTFTTSRLSTGSDTVIHVQSASDPNSGFIAGNDDATPGMGYASSVTVPAPTADRALRVVVRPYAASTAGTCDLTASSSAGSSTVRTGISFGAEFITTPALRALTHVVTTEVAQNAHDTLLLVVPRNSPSHAVAFDDDDGLDFMSWLDLPEACGTAFDGGCYLLVSNFSAFASGITNLVYDEDVHFADSDGDALGDGLEATIGADPGNDDTDRDGIEDGVELLGVDVSPSVLNFPVMGAQVLSKDLFLEIDWQTCSGTMTCPGGPDQYQMPADVAAAVAQRFLPVRIHMDIGTVNPNADPTLRTQWGDWRGAMAVPNLADCAGFSPARRPYFHHQVSSWNSQAGVGQCGQAVAAVGYTDHELGHNFNLQHQGPPASGLFNCKPNYPSPMNYAYEFDSTNAPTFSHGALPALNPVALDETLVPLPANIIAKLGDPTDNWRFMTDNVNGRVDWNRDGEFSPAGTLVRGNPAGTPGNHQCGGMMNSFSLISGGAPRVASDVSMAWQTLPWPGGSRLLVFGRLPPTKPGTTVLGYFAVSQSTLDSSCGGHFSVHRNDCAGIANQTPIKTTITTNRAAAVAEIPGGGSSLLVVVSEGTANFLSSRTMTTSANGMTSISARQDLPGGGQVMGDPAALRIGNSVVVWAPVIDGRLRRWIYTNGRWSQPIDDQWSDGVMMHASAGIAVVAGTQDGVTVMSPYAVIPTHGALVFAHFESGRWRDLNAWPDSIGMQFTHARPGLAYVPFSSQTPQEGRFYLAWNQILDPAGKPTEALWTMTQGNRTFGSSRRLSWLPISTVMETSVQGGVSLMFDLTRDSHLRAAVRDGLNRFLFSPLADQLMDIDMRDNDDYAYLEGHMRATLGKESFYLP